MKFFRFLFSKHENCRWAFFVALLLTLTVVSTAFAATITYKTGPVWLYPATGYRFTADVSGMSPPDKDIGIAYHNSDNTISGCADCTCPGCSGNNGTYECIIPVNIPGPTVSWDISSYSNPKCSSKKTQGPTGIFATGPDSVGLKTLTVENTDASPSSIWPILVIAAVTVLPLLALGWTYRIRKNKLAMS